jgi:hypothetical protein
MEGVNKRIKHQVEVEHHKSEVPDVNIYLDTPYTGVKEDLCHELRKPRYEVQADQQTDVHEDFFPA